MVGKKVVALVAAVATVGFVSAMAVRQGGPDASGERLRDVSGRLDAARMANWHMNASMAAKSIREPGAVPREAVGADWLDPNGMFGTATDGDGRVVTWAGGERQDWPQIAKALEGMPGASVGRIVATAAGAAFEAADGSTVRLPSDVAAPEGAPAIAGTIR